MGIVKPPGMLQFHCSEDKITLMDQQFQLYDFKIEQWAEKLHANAMPCHKDTVQKIVSSERIRKNKGHHRSQNIDTAPLDVWTKEHLQAEQ